MKTKEWYVACLDTDFQNKLARALIDGNCDSEPPYVDLVYEGRKIKALPIDQSTYDCLLESRKNIENNFQVVIDLYVKDENEKTGECTVVKKMALRRPLKKAVHRGLKELMKRLQDNLSAAA